MDGVERNVQNVRGLEEAFNGRDYSLLGELISASFKGHNPGSYTVTVEGLRDNNEAWHAAMPDKGTEVIFAFGSGDLVVARIKDRGSNFGGVPWLGIPANGKMMDIDWIQITRHDEQGRIVEMWALADVPRLLSQLGATLRWGD